MRASTGATRIAVGNAHQQRGDCDLGDSSRVAGRRPSQSVGWGRRTCHGRPQHDQREGRHRDADVDRVRRSRNRRPGAAGPRREHASVHWPGLGACTGLASDGCTYKRRSGATSTRADRRSVKPSTCALRRGTPWETLQGTGELRLRRASRARGHARARGPDCRRSASTGVPGSSREAVGPDQRTRLNVAPLPDC
jgi:hypothetical protein